MSARADAHVVNVVGRTPGPRGRAPMVAEINGASRRGGVGSHQEAAYVGAIKGLFDAWCAGHEVVEVTSTSEHLVMQMRGEWKVGEGLAPYRALASMLADRFASVSWTKV